MISNTAQAVEKKKTTDPANWVGNYADYLFRYAITRLGNEDQCRDLVQETFLAGLEKLDNFKGVSSEKTWLTAILKNKLIDIYRKKSSGLTKHTESEDPDYEQQEFFDPADGHWNVQHRPAAFGIEHQDHLVSKEFQQILQQCMQKLPALWFAVFSMKHMDEEATEFICAELKVSPSNFWVIIHRTKVSLRSCLQKNWL
jgi:RNA polymerase sigma-70 factor (TIGR02943 family)